MKYGLNKIHLAALQIVRRSAYLLLTEDRHLRSLLLDVVREGCEVVQSRQEQLLPLAHKIWQSLITFHRGSDFIIMRKVGALLFGTGNVHGISLGDFASRLLSAWSG